MRAGDVMRAAYLSVVVDHQDSLECYKVANDASQMADHPFKRERMIR